MEWLTHAIGAASDWATGHGAYMKLSECMGGDYFWITLTICLCLAVAAGYGLIGYHWNENRKRAPVNSSADLALVSIRNIFLLCGFCSYIFLPIKMFWPGWRIYDLFMIGLVFYTWRYAINAHGLRVIYRELGRSEKLSKDLEESREQSRRKTFFLNAVSHDLRTPLNGIMLQSHLAEISAQACDGPALQQALREIQASARTTADVLDQLLDFARLEADSLRVETFTVESLLNHVVHSLHGAAHAKGIELRSSSGGVATLTTDRAKVSRVLLNLVENAIKYTASGSVSVDAYGDAECVTLSVADTGAGIPEEQRERIFEEFVQLHNVERDRTKGVGLGLTIARRMVEQLGGKLSLDGTYTGGARFVVRLPQIAEAKTAAPIPELSRV
jgi:signal transduction histidine kinase